MATAASTLPDKVSAPGASTRASVTHEAVIYLIIGFLALVLRVAELDIVPLNGNEARQALATWRALNPDDSLEGLISSSPLLLSLQGVSFSLLGPGEFSSRILTALAGLALILSPVLFRERLGHRRALLTSAILAASPVLLIASRSADSVIWSTLLGILWLWCLIRFLTIPGGRLGLGVIVVGMSLMLLSGPGGIPLMIMLAIASVAASGRFIPGVNPASRQGDRIATNADHVLRLLPWGNGILMGTLVVILGATSLLVYPAGFASVGEALVSSVRGVTLQSSDSGLAFPVALGLFYEPAVVVLGVAAIWWMIRQDRLTVVERFLIGWAIVGTLFAALYPGASPSHALWFLIPLGGLVSALIDACLIRSESVLWWTVPVWARWLVTLALIALLSMFAIHAQAVARGMLSAPDSPFQFGSTNSINAVWVIVIAVFVIIGFFLSASLWGTGTTLRGSVLGFALFMMATSLGSGWRAAVFRSEDPAELSNRSATSLNVTLLRQTLLEIAQRESGSFPLIEGAAVVPSDGVVAWLLRDFPKIEFVADIAEAKGKPVIIMPMQSELPDLGGPYVGQRFVLASGWHSSALDFAQWPAWWLQRRTLIGGVPISEVVLWLRQDTYDGVNPDNRS